MSAGCLISGAPWYTVWLTCTLSTCRQSLYVWTLEHYSLYVIPFGIDSVGVPVGAGVIILHSTCEGSSITPTCCTAIWWNKIWLLTLEDYIWVHCSTGICLHSHSTGQSGRIFTVTLLAGGEKETLDYSSCRSFTYLSMIQFATLHTSFQFACTSGLIH